MMIDTARIMRNPLGSRTVVSSAKRVLELVVLGALLQAAEARATTITVTTTDDEVAITGNCSLREAVIAANTDAAVDTCAAGAGAVGAVSGVEGPAPSGP